MKQTAYESQQVVDVTGSLLQGKRFAIDHERQEISNVDDPEERYPIEALNFQRYRPVGLEVRNIEFS